MTLPVRGPTRWTPSSPPGCLKFRRPLTQAWGAALSGLACLLFLGGVIGARGEAPGRAAQMVAWGALAGLMLWLTIRLVRSGIVTSGGGVTFCNFLRTRRLRWDEIERFESPTPYGGVRNTGLRAKLFDGGVVYSSIYAAGPFTRRGFADDVVGQLNELLGAARPSASPARP